ncbi:MAG: DUF4153 domain-containing protein [Sedimentibacter sp.]
MNKIKKFINNISSNLKTTFVRFPIAILFLAFISVILYIEIDGNFTVNEDFLGRLAFTGIFGFFLAVAIQFKLERYHSSIKYTLVYGILNFILAAAYFVYMTNTTMSQSMFIHLFVISFALFASYLYIPSAKNLINFGDVALSHFKAAFTAILYGVVLYIGFVAIIGAIDLLLYKLDTNIYAHMANIVFVFFTPLYYLSLLPKFNSDDELDLSKKEVAYTYPKVLEILVSYIMIPLISIFSIVLIIYFIKILVTGVWPVGQVGPMVLGYSAVGYFIYILSSNLQNHFSVLFRKFFPMVLIPLVMMQLLSSYIRIEAYGITESRYYVVLFGIFSIVCALMLILGKKKSSNTIVLLSAIFAILSIIPPVDAFSISMNSQKARLEEILIRNNMLVDNEIVSKADIPNEDKSELTNITYYMVRMGYLSDVEWFPEEFNSEPEYYGNFEKIYGFKEYYNNYSPGETPTFVYAMLDPNEQIEISGFDIFINAYINNNSKTADTIGNFIIGENNYTIQQNTINKDEIVISLLDEEKNIVLEASMKELTDLLFENAGESKELMSPGELTINSQNSNVHMRILVNNINIDKSDTTNTSINGNILIFIAIP